MGSFNIKSLLRSLFPRSTRLLPGPLLFSSLRPSTADNPSHLPQLIHQGTKLIPADFLAPVESQNPIRGGLHHEILLSNFFAQPEALAFGKDEATVKAELGAAASNEALLKSKVFEGNRPTNSILFQKLTPKTLGEDGADGRGNGGGADSDFLCRVAHRYVRAQDLHARLHLGYQLLRYVSSQPFFPPCLTDPPLLSPDQMGVELGKVLAKNILSQLPDPTKVVNHDSSTTGIIHHYQSRRKL